MKIIFECCINECNNTFEINNYIKDIRIKLPLNWSRIDINKNNEIIHHYMCDECTQTYFQFD